MGEKELAKMRKRAEKEERGSRAALAAHQVLWDVWRSSLVPALLRCH